MLRACQSRAGAELTQRIPVLRDEDVHLRLCPEDLGKDLAFAAAKRDAGGMSAGSDASAARCALDCSRNEALFGVALSDKPQAINTPYDSHLVFM